MGTIVTRNDDAVQAIQMATNDTSTSITGQRFARAAREASDRLLRAGWPGGEVIQDVNRKTVAIWKSPTPFGKTFMALDAEGNAYYWAAHAAEDRTGLWCPIRWDAFNGAPSVQVQNQTDWMDSLAA